MQMNYFPIAPHSGTSHDHIPILGTSLRPTARACASPEMHPHPGPRPRAAALPQALPRPAPSRPAPNPSATHVTSAACDDLIPGVG